MRSRDPRQRFDNVPGVHGVGQPKKTRKQLKTKLKKQPKKVPSGESMVVHSG